MSDQERFGGSVEEGLATYLRLNDLPADGGDSERWAVVRIARVPLAYPNITARRAAVRYHDLHHVVTGYSTDLRGESEISAWEVGSGCDRYWVAWFLDLSGLLSGLRWPMRTARALARGRQTRNLYGSDYGTVLTRSVSEVRAELGLDRATSLRPSDLMALMAWLPVAVIASGLVVGTAVVTSPWWLTSGAHRQRRSFPRDTPRDR